MSDKNYLNDGCFKIMEDLNNMRLYSNWDMANNLRMILNANIVKTSKSSLASVLDLGCGRGILYEYLLRMNLKKDEFVYHGVELNSSYYDYAIDKYKNESNFIIEQCKLEDSTLLNTKDKYDYIFMLEVIEHLDFDMLNKLLPLISDSLHEEGMFIVSTPNPDKLNGQEFVWPDDHFFEYSRAELIDRLSFYFTLDSSYGWWTNSKYMRDTIKEAPILEAYDKLSKVLPPSALDPVFCMLYPEKAKQATYLFKKKK